MKLNAIRSLAFLRCEAGDRLDIGARVHQVALAIELGDPRARGFENAQQTVDPTRQDGQIQLGPRGRHVLAHDLSEPHEVSVALAILCSSWDGKDHAQTDDGPWIASAGRTDRVPRIPAVMVAWNDRVFLLDRDRLSEYVPAGDVWLEEELRLPGAVGSGVAATVDPSGALFVLRGGETNDFWRVDLRSGAIEGLPPTPEPVGAGGSLAYDREANTVHALRGDRTSDYWRYEVVKEALRRLVSLVRVEIQ